MHSRYIIVLDRYGDDDYVSLRDPQRLNDYYGPPRSDQEGVEQVARELQEAMDQNGAPAGFFNVITRMEVERNEEGANVSTIDPAILRAKLIKE
jgi:hypothetical protein